MHFVFNPDTFALGLAVSVLGLALLLSLVVSGLRIDSPLLSGVEWKFRVIVTNSKLAMPLGLPAAQAWLDNLASRFKAWPSSHRSRSILVVAHGEDTAERFEADFSY